MSSTSEDINIYHYIKSEDRYIHALVIPRGRLEEFSCKPLAWLRYVGACVSQHDGSLATTSEGPCLADYSSMSPVPENLYFIRAKSNEHHNDYQDWFVQLETLVERTSLESGEVDQRRVNFFKKVEEQAGGKCVLLGDGIMVDACHFVPHCKGSAYIQTVLGIASIDDPRNGILLSTLLHGRLARVETAFLRTPSKYLTIHDIPTIGEIAPDTAQRLTWQRIIDPNKWKPTVVDYAALHNQDATFNPDASDDTYPSSEILDYAYGATIVTHFGTPQFKDFIHKQYHDEIKPHVNELSYIPEDEDDVAANEDKDTWDDGGMSTNITMPGAGAHRQLDLDGFDAVMIMAMRSFVMRERARLAETMERWTRGLDT